MANHQKKYWTRCLPFVQYSNAQYQGHDLNAIQMFINQAISYKLDIFVWYSNALIMILYARFSDSTKKGTWSHDLNTVIVHYSDPSVIHLHLQALFSLQVWNEGTSGTEGGIRLYLREIIPLLVKSFIVLWVKPNFRLFLFVVGYRGLNYYTLPNIIRNSPQLRSYRSYP